jgi:putative restriction endonuclease
MPAISPKLMVNRIIDAIQQSGGSAAFMSQSSRGHPREFVINYLGQRFSLWVYIWTVTHGGRPSLPDEYRIQKTGVTSPMLENPHGLTVIMGYYPDLNMFAGFDFTKHHIFTPGSPSAQINMSAINLALQNGLSFSIKDNEDIAIGVRPDQFINYCMNAMQLHLQGSDDDLGLVLKKAFELEEIPEGDISALSADRKTLLSSVKRLSRDANFKKKVLGAYDNRCAVTRSQLKLIDAAHILPVVSSSSSDHVTNGLALSPTFHRAYDNCLIYLDENFYMRLNTEKSVELTALGLDGGLTQFSSFLDKVIHLPADVNQRPRSEFINLANKHRQIPGY